MPAIKVTWAELDIITDSLTAEIENRLEENRYTQDGDLIEYNARAVKNARALRKRLNSTLPD